MSADLDQLGPRLRAMRRTRGMTLAEVSAGTTVSISTLSRVESGMRIPSITVLLSIAGLYRVSLDEIVRPARDPRVTGHPMRRGRSTFVPLTRVESGLRAYKQIIPGRAVPPKLEQSTHGGYEWLYVLSGRLRLALGEEDIELEAGEVAEFDTLLPHATDTADGRPVEVLTLFGAAGERMHVRARSERRGEDPPG